MLAIPWIIDKLADLWWYLWELYLGIIGIPLIGDPLGWIILRIQEIIASLIDALWEFDAWVTEVASTIRDFLSWDAILDRLYLYFPFLRDPLGGVWDWIRSFIDTYFPWVYDPELTIWEWVGAKARDLAYHLLPWSDIPEMGVREEAERWFLGILYRVLPWGDDPDLTILAEARAWVSEQIPELADIGQWIEDHLMAWLEDRAVDIAKMAGRILERMW